MVYATKITTIFRSGQMIRTLFALVVLLSAANVSRAYAIGPKLDAKSRSAVIMIEITLPHQTTESAADLGEISAQLAPYSEAKGDLIRNFWHMVQYDETSVYSENGFAWLVFVVDPGTYVLRDLFAQRHWGVCYDAGTRAFTVSAGEAKVLGRVNPTADYLAISKLPRTVAVQRQLRNLLIGQIAYKSQLQLTEADKEPTVMTEAITYAEKALPNVRVPLSPLPSRPVTFNLGYDALHIAKSCN